MMFRMFIHSTVFTFLIALGAVMLNGSSFLGNGSSWNSSGNSMWRGDDHNDRRWRHDDD